MTYLPGDCLFIPLSNEYHIVVFVANTDEYSYQLAFLDYYETLPLPADYFEKCSFFVFKFGSNDQSFIAFETVTINKFLLDNAPGVNFAGHLDLPGRIGLNGLVPMADVSDITSYFEQYLRNYESQRYEEQYSPFQRSLMDLNEVAKYATPINPFNTVKLYKEAGQTIYYWQIYGELEPACLVLSQGKLGAEGEYQEIKDKPLDNLKEMYARLIEEKKTEGFRESEEISNMILQFGTTDSWGSTDDLAFHSAGR